MSPEQNLVLMVRGARQIRPGRDVDGATPRGEPAPACVGIVAVATCPVSAAVRS